MEAISQKTKTGAHKKRKIKDGPGYDLQRAFDMVMAPSQAAKAVFCGCIPHIQTQTVSFGMCVLRGGNACDSICDDTSPFGNGFAVA